MHENITIDLTENQVTAAVAALDYQAGRLDRMKGGTDSIKRWRGYEVMELRGMVRTIEDVRDAAINESLEDDTP